MPGYVQQALNKFQYGIKSTHKATDAPHPYKATKKHGLPMTHPTDDSTKLTPSHQTSPTDRVYLSVLFQSRAPHHAHGPEHNSNRANPGHPHY